MIDFKQILIGGIKYLLNETRLVDYFKEEAKKAKQYEFVEFNTFFADIKKEVNEGISDISWQRSGRIGELDSIIIGIKSGSGIKFEKSKTEYGYELITDLNEQRLKDALQYYEERVQFEINNNNYEGYTYYPNGRTGGTRVEYAGLKLMSKAIEQAERELNKEFFNSLGLYEAIDYWINVFVKYVSRKAKATDEGNKAISDFIIEGADCIIIKINQELKDLNDKDKKRLASYIKDKIPFLIPKNENKVTQELNDLLFCMVKGYVDSFFKTLGDEGTNEHQQKITIHDDVLKWLQETICSNRKPFIEKATGNTIEWNWLQNKELARLLLTHIKIKGSLTDADVERQAPTLFFYPKEKNALQLAKPKKKQITSIDYDTLSDYLATL